MTPRRVNLVQGLGDDFTPGVSSAWAAAYAALSDMMMITATYPAES